MVGLYSIFLKYFCVYYGAETTSIVGTLKSDILNVIPNFEGGTMTDSTVSLPAVDKTTDVKAILTEMAVYETEQGPVKLMGMDGKPLVETDLWKLFVAELPEPKGQLGLFMIATSPEHNDVIVWQSSVLGDMQELAAYFDTKADSPEFAPNYGAFFPRVVANIDADGRAAVVLGYHPIVTTYRELRPVSTIPADKRVDLKTVMWMLGKSLKLATLFHTDGTTIGKVTADNLFITMDNLDVHGVFYFDFSFSETFVSDEVLKAELAEMARTSWMAAGGTDSTVPPHDSDIMTVEQHALFTANLKRMMDGEVADAVTEMDRLYALNDEIWPKIPIEGGPNSRGQTHKRQ